MQMKGCPLMAATKSPGCGERCAWFNQTRNCCSILAISMDLETLNDNMEELLAKMPADNESK